MSLVTIASFSNAFNMHVVKGRLETEGIPCFAKDEHTVSTNPLYAVALGGIKLQVREEDAPEALRIMAEMGYVYRPAPPEPQKRGMHPLLRFIIFLLVFACVLTLIFMLHDPTGTFREAPPPTLPMPARGYH